MATFAIDVLSGKQYIFNEDFINTGCTTFSGITSANNGLTCVNPHKVQLGGQLISPTVFTDVRGTPVGLQYGADYSASFTSRSLVDKGYADTKLPQTTFASYSANTLSELRYLDNYTGNGVITGFTITINADPTKINISSGLGYLINNHTNPNIPVKTKLIFTGKTGVILTGLTLNNITYLAIDINGNVVQQQTEYLATQRRDYILIGAAIHSNKIIVNAINNLPDVIIDAHDQFNDLLDSLKNFNVEGNVFMANGANLKINKSFGKVFKRGVNFINDNKNPHRISLAALTAPTNIRYRLSDGTEYSNTDSISLYYESPLGTRIPLPSTGYSIQRITIFPSNLIRIQYGQAKYDSMAFAKQSINTEVFTTEQNIAQNGLLRAYLIVKGSTTSLTNTNDALFIEADKFGTMPLGASVGATTLQQAYVNSVIPLLTTSTAEGSVMFKRGSLTDDDDVFEILNGAGNISASINGNGIGKFNALRPTGDTTTAIQIRKTNGTTSIINVNTISGFTGFGTIAPIGLIHTYGTDNTVGDGFNIQTNGVRLDGAIDTDKDIVWLDNGETKFAAQIFRNEGGKFWYLYNINDHNNSITVSESGRVGINNKTNTMNYHAILLNGSPNDLNVGGTYTQDISAIYQIQIYSTGATDTFKWRISLDNGNTYSTWSAPSGCTTGDTLIQYGVTISFDDITGHQLNTTFEFPAFAQLPIGTFVISTNAFTEVQTTNNYNANPIIYDDITAAANSSSIGGNVVIFNTGTTNNAIYFGTKIKIDSIYVNLKTMGAGITNTVYLQYLNSSSGWTTITTSDKYSDGTLSLSQSGALTWDSSALNDWTAEYMKDLIQPNYQLYWLRLITSSSPTIAPIANSFARGGNYRLAVLASPSDVRPSMYVDSLGRTNIGGGNISGSNLFQINCANTLEGSATASQSLAEIDSNDSGIVDLKIKLASNDNLGAGYVLFKSRGTLDTPLGICSGDTLGHLDFRGRIGTNGRYLSRVCSQYVGDGTTRLADLTINNANGSDPVEMVRFKHDGNSGFGITNPIAVIHLKAGTTTNAPLKFTAGQLLSVPQVGAVEFDGHCFYFTVTGSTVRKTFASLENPQFSGNTNLPTTTCLNGISLCNYILQSGGTNNTTLVKTCNFNTFTGSTTPIVTTVITGATNGLNKPTVHRVGLGGNLTQDTVITGSNYNFTLSGKLLNICGVNGIEIIDTSTQGIDINSNGNSVDIRGGTLAGVEKTKFLVSATQATFTDSRTGGTAAGIQYNADYSANYTDRSLVDKAYVISQASGLIPLAAVEVATIANINLASAPATIDSVTLTGGMRVLVKNQGTGANNGIYVFNGAGSAMTRSSDFSGGTTNWKGTYTSILSGATNKNTSWILDTPNPINIGTTPLTFVLFSSQAGTVGGNGICVTQSGGNNVVAVKLAASNCGLCSDTSGLYITPTIGGIGICFDGNSLCFNGSAIAGNSLSWTGTQLAVNTTGGTLNSALNSKLNISTFCSYTGATLITINSKAAQSSLVTYTGTTAPATFATKSAINTYTGTTAPNTYVKITCYNAYTGATHTCMDRHAYLSGATFTGVVNVCKPAVNDNTNCVATTSWYISQGATALPLIDGIAACGISNMFARQDHVHPTDTTRTAQSSLVTYTGTTAPATYVKITCYDAYTGATQITINTLATKSAINTYTGTTAVATYATKSAINTYTGTTAVATYATKSAINTYTGTTAPNTFAPKASPTFTGTVTIPTPFVLGAISVVATGTVINYLTGATSNIQTQINTKAPIVSPTFTTSACAPTPSANNNSTCIATTAWYFGQCGQSTPLMDGVAAVGSSCLWAHDDHRHPTDTTRVAKAGDTMTGALVINSNLTVTGTTILRGTTCLGAPTTGDITTNKTLFYNTTSCAITAIKLTGGSDNYGYCECTTTLGTTCTTCVKYLGYSATTITAGRYQVDINAQFGSPTANSCAFAAIKIDGTTQGLDFAARENVASWFLPANVSRDITFTTATHCFDIYVWTGGGAGACACMPRANVRFKRIC